MVAAKSRGRSNHNLNPRPDCLLYARFLANADSLVDSTLSLTGGRALGTVSSDTQSSNPIRFAVGVRRSDRDGGTRRRDKAALPRCGLSAPYRDKNTATATVPFHGHKRNKCETLGPRRP